jgi:murein DD-endopeptidase MepM/ murein hydrolase activator NlpD
MTPATAVPTRVPGFVLVVVLGLVPVLLAPGRAYSAPGDVDPVGVWPLTPVPRVVDGFDPPSSTWGAGHRGVDLLGTIGQPVRTALSGTVTFAGRIAGRGVVVVSHGATRTTYEPVSAAVRVGDALTAGARLGRLELPGSHCFPRACLHWGWLRGETYLDPLALLGAGPVRLLPLSQPAPAPGAGDQWRSPAPAYAGWRPPAGIRTPAQARGCACW